VRQLPGPDGYDAFIPAPLPPDPPVDFTPELRQRSEEAAHALGRLDGASSTMDPDRLLYDVYVRKEAVLSSQIEGTQSTLSDLLRNGRGAHQAPGEFRRSQNWIGGTPPILKAGIAHAQFETIHPFLDGNGRVGRLLVSLLFVADGVLQQPFFYLSLYLKENRADYYEALQRVRTHGDWEGWIRFYLIGVEAVARQATRTTQVLLALFRDDEARVFGVGRSAGTALRVYDALRRKVIVSATRVAGELEITWPAVQAALERLEGLGIAKEITGRARGRLYAYERQLEILNRGVGEGIAPPRSSASPGRSRTIPAR
jgi:Fic family protein